MLSINYALLDSGLWGNCEFWSDAVVSRDELNYFRPYFRKGADYFYLRCHSFYYTWKVCVNAPPPCTISVTNTHFQSKKHLLANE